ncbi:alpha/beta fold hydrolase [Longispora albida]|uniref:alpha/beta fold hydrolase n=1 Tax=Longispora albida TaxID=203523 RepID=UPI000363E7E7|nr:alpha/beta hydrolase [Longispora albida]
MVSEDILPPATGTQPPWPGREVALDGQITHVRETPATSGDAEPALYVHGLGGSGQNWTELAGLLAPRLDGQAIDLPGFGLSEPGKRYGVAAFSARVIRWIEDSGRGPVHLFGNSLGGAVSVRVAANRPDLVRSLVLISPAMPFVDPRWSFHSRLIPLLLVPRVEKLAARRLTAMDPAEVARTALQLCYADPDRVSAQQFAEAEEEARFRQTQPWYTEAYIRTFRDLVGTFVRAYLPGSGSLWRIAAQVEAPTLVISGRQDKLVDVRVAPQVATTIPDSRLLILDQVGHVAQMEVPRTVARAVIGLLDELRATTDRPRAGG